MINEKQKIRISKFLSLVLRHKPQTIGIELDENGWTDVETLIEKSKQKGLDFDLEILDYVVETNSKKRFAFNDDKSKIRASQGHSIQIDLGYTTQMPPTILYHGTGQQSVEIIKKTGLKKLQRHHVHLSQDLETATAVGKRHGKPFIFKVLAAQMQADGHEFFVSENGVWLVDFVPVEYLKY